MEASGASWRFYLFYLGTWYQRMHNNKTKNTTQIFKNDQWEQQMEIKPPLCTYSKLSVCLSNKSPHKEERLKYPWSRLNIYFIVNDRIWY